MALKEVLDLNPDTTVSLGGFNKKLRKDNPTSIEGYFLGSRQVTSPKSKSGFAYIHVFQTPKGTVGVWGKTDMDMKMKQVTPGGMTKVWFDRMVPTPNGEMYKYKVAVDDEDTIPVSEAAFGSSANEQDTTTDEEETQELDTAADEEDDATESLAAEAAARQKKVQDMINNKKKAALTK